MSTPPLCSRPARCWSQPARATPAPLASAELFDPLARNFNPTGGLAGKPAWFSATLLPSGLVLAAGGSNGAGSLASAELYDPLAGTWSATAGAPGSPRSAAFGRPSCRPAAGAPGRRPRRPRERELFDPASGVLDRRRHPDRRPLQPHRHPAAVRPGTGRRRQLRRRSARQRPSFTIRIPPPGRAPRPSTRRGASTPRPSC